MSTYQLDARTLRCPEPLMLLKAKMRTIAPGDTVELLSDDPVSARDVPAYCQFIGHILLATPSSEHPHRYVVQKKSS